MLVPKEHRSCEAKHCLADSFHSRGEFRGIRVGVQYFNSRRTFDRIRSARIVNSMSISLCRHHLLPHTTLTSAHLKDIRTNSVRLWSLSSANRWLPTKTDVGPFQIQNDRHLREERWACDKSQCGLLSFQYRELEYNLYFFSSAHFGPRRRLTVKIQCPV
jgi:hypothetical protein